MDIQKKWRINYAKNMTCFHQCMTSLEGGGCWFCPNAKEKELCYLRKNHRELWNKLLELEKDTETIGNVWNILTKTRIHDWEEIFQMEDRQIQLEI